jgi:hypothetical protein
MKTANAMGAPDAPEERARDEAHDHRNRLHRALRRWCSALVHCAANGGAVRSRHTPITHPARTPPCTTGKCVDLVFKLSYGNMLYIGKSGHFTLKWPNFP